MFKIPHQFLSSLKPGHFKMSAGEMEIKRTEKAIQMNKLFQDHFTKQLATKHKRPPTNREILEAIAHPDVQKHAKEQIATQMEVLVQTHEVQEANKIEKIQIDLVESKI